MVAVILLMFNEPTAYATYNTNSSSATRLILTDSFLFLVFPTNITGIVDQEYRAVNHGTYQQIALPFYDKTILLLAQN
jgi:hypothetical protein